MHDCYKASLHHLMRPNLIIYLDAPVETVGFVDRSRFACIHSISRFFSLAGPEEDRVPRQRVGQGLSGLV